MKSRAWLGPAAVAVVCGLGLLHAGLDPRPSSDVAPSVPQPSAEALAMLGLRPGDRIVGWTVLGIDGPGEDGTRVDVGRGDVRFSITIVELGASEPSAPLSTDRHALYYGHAHPPGTTPPAGAVRALLHQLANRVRKHERRVDAPVDTSAS